MDLTATADHVENKSRFSKSTIQTRYAIYYAPRRNSPLNRFGKSWLGRDALTGAALPQPELDGVFPEELTRLVSPAAFYGFHGTLKSPFSLSSTASKEALIKALKAFVAKETSFLLPKLVLIRMGRFLALTPEGPCPQLNALAERCVKFFDTFRRPLTQVELIRRRTAGLNPQQEKNLQKWGYPYVLDEFKFHLTLTGPIFNPILAEHLIQVINKQLLPLPMNAIEVNDICLFVKENEKKPFMLHSRYPFGRRQPQKRNT